MLNVEGGVHLDPGVQQVERVLPPLLMPDAWRVRVRELVEQKDRGLAGQGGFEIELAEHDASMLDFSSRENGEAADERLRLGTAMRFDAADDDIDPVVAEPARPFQHRVGLPDAGGEPKVDFEFRATTFRFRIVDAL